MQTCPLERRSRRSTGPALVLAGFFAVPLLGGASAHCASTGNEPPRPPAATLPTAADRLELLGFAILQDGAGTTGRHSSYHGRTMEQDELFDLPEFLDQRLRFGGRLVPAQGSVYDEGVLAYRIEGDQLVVAVACGVGAENWHQGHSDNFVGQGDLFVTARQGRDVQQFALLNDMNGCRTVGVDGRWRPAQRFRYTTEAEVGHAVFLDAEEQIVTSGGDQGHARGENSPEGLDERIFACGGETTGLGSVRHFDFEAVQPLEGGDTMRWFVSEWTVPLVVFGDEEEAMELAFHIAPSCGNDQIGGVLVVPSKSEREAAGPTRRRAELN